MSTTRTPTDRRPLRRAVAAALAALLALTALGATSATPAGATTCPDGLIPTFTDVGAAHPFCREIESAHSEGFVNGYPDGEYKPTNVVTRQAAAAVLWRIATHDQLIAIIPCAAAPYPDVPTGHAFCREIRDATLAGVFSGYPDGTFRPGNPMTRLAMAMVLARFPEGPMLLAPCMAPPFADIPTDHPQCAQIQYAKSTGILTGYADGTFRPGAPMTRQAFAAVALRTWNHISST